MVIDKVNVKSTFLCISKILVILLNGFLYQPKKITTTEKLYFFNQRYEGIRLLKKLKINVITKVLMYL